MKPTVPRRRVRVGVGQRGGGRRRPLLGRRVALVGLGGQPTVEELVPGAGDADQAGPGPRFGGGGRIPVTSRQITAVAANVSVAGVDRARRAGSARGRGSGECRRGWSARSTCAPGPWPGRGRRSRARSYRSSRPGRNVAGLGRPRGRRARRRSAGSPASRPGGRRPPRAALPAPAASARMTASRPSASTPGPGRQPVAQRSARRELHDEVRATVVELTDVVDRDHERAVDPAEELGLPHEAGPRCPGPMAWPASRILIAASPSSASS